MSGPISQLRAGDREGAFVLLHGFTGSRESWRDVAALAETRSALFAVDLPGHHSVPVRTTTFEEGVSEIAAELAALDLRGPRVVGYSLGGRIALALLARTRLFAGGVLIGATAGLETLEARSARRADDERWATQLEASGLEAFIGAWEVTPVLRPASAVPEARLRAQRAVRAAHDPAGLAASLRTFGLGAMPNLWPELPGVEGPVTVVVGEHDAKFRPIAERLAGALPAGTLEVVEGSGHNVVLERPELIARLLR